MFIEVTLRVNGSKCTINAARIREVYTAWAKPGSTVKCTWIHLSGDDEAIPVEEGYLEIQELMSSALDIEVPVRKKSGMQRHVEGILKVMAGVRLEHADEIKERYDAGDVLTAQRLILLDLELEDTREKVKPKEYLQPLNEVIKDMSVEEAAAYVDKMMDGE